MNLRREASLLAVPRSKAIKIYRGKYVIAPGFGRIGNVSMPIAAELVDTGVNMGPPVAARFLQRALNGLEDVALTVDGEVGDKTIAALAGFLKRRGAEGERRLLALLNAQQGARYLELVEESERRMRGEGPLTSSVDPREAQAGFDAEIAAWTHPNADPLADIRDALSAMIIRPTHAYMSVRVWIAMRRAIAKSTLTKRAFRRWRGRERARQVALRRAGAIIAVSPEGAHAVQP